MSKQDLTLRWERDLRQLKDIRPEVYHTSQRLLHRTLAKDRYSARVLIASMCADEAKHSHGASRQQLRLLGMRFLPPQSMQRDLLRWKKETT